MPNHILHLEKQSLRRLDRSVMKTQLSYVTERALGGNRGKHWSIPKEYIIPSQPTGAQGENYIYTVKIQFERKGRSVSDDIVERQWEIIQDMAENAGRASRWSVIREKDSVVTQISELTSIVNFLPEKLSVIGSPKSSNTERAYTQIELPKVDSIESNRAHLEFFSHLYDREAQIAIAHSAIQAFIDSKYENRFHAVLYGPPACGKTEVLRSFARWLGPEAVLNFDATSTTKAGAEKVLLETANIPPILMVEEIEKTEEQSLRWLLSVLDHRGEVRKITFRTVAQRNIKLLCLATVNDIELFKRVMDGALASRFAHKIYCPRPNREVLERILLREIKAYNGKEEWIKPTLDFCLDIEKTTDPRRIIAVCMSGKDALLDGGYQKFLEKAMEKL